MVGNRSIGIRTLCLFWQVILVTISFWCWLAIWSGEVLDEPLGWQRYLICNEFLLVGILFGSGSSKREVRGPHAEWVKANRLSVRQACLAILCVFLVLFVLKDRYISRSFFLSYLPGLYVVLLFSNYWLPRSLERWSFNGDREERVALAGTTEKASELKPWLERKNQLGLRTVGIVCPKLEPAGVSPFPVLGTIDEMGDILKKCAITQLIVLDLSLGSDWIKRLTQLCEGTAVRMLALQNLNEYFNHTTTTFEDDGVRFIAL